MIKEIEEARKLNNEELEKEIQNTKNFHMSEIESKKLIILKFFLLIKLDMGIADQDLIDCMKEDLDLSIRNVISQYNEKFIDISSKIKKRYEIK
jgi:hypothetical protein